MKGCPSRTMLVTSSDPVLHRRLHSELYGLVECPVKPCTKLLGPPLLQECCTVNPWLYASPAWWGLLNESDLNRLESFLRRARRGRFLPDEALTFNF